MNGLSGTYEEWKDKVPGLGEWIRISDRNAFIIGDGEHSVEQLYWLRNGKNNRVFLTSVDDGVSVKEIWNEGLDVNGSPGKVSDAIFDIGLPAIVETGIYDVSRVPYIRVSNISFPISNETIDNIVREVYEDTL